MFKKDLLQGKRILITGGGTGLGKEMANHFADMVLIYSFVEREMF